MSAVNFLLDWIQWLLIIIPVGAGATITYYALSKTLSSDEAQIGHCNHRIKQTIKGAIVGMCLSGLISIIRLFYM